MYYLFKQDFPVSTSTLQVSYFSFQTLYFLTFFLLHRIFSASKIIIASLKNVSFWKLFLWARASHYGKELNIGAVLRSHIISVSKYSEIWQTSQILCGRFYQWSKFLCLVFDFKVFSFFINFYFHFFSSWHKWKHTCKLSICLNFETLVFIWDFKILFCLLVNDSYFNRPFFLSVIVVDLYGTRSLRIPSVSQISCEHKITFQLIRQSRIQCWCGFVLVAEGDMVFHSS